jgi:hypothetical protein
MAVCNSECKCELVKYNTKIPKLNTFSHFNLTFKIRWQTAAHKEECFKFWFQS